MLFRIKFDDQAFFEDGGGHLFPYRKSLDFSPVVGPVEHNPGRTSPTGGGIEVFVDFGDLAASLPQFDHVSRPHQA
jgi:hypothetical protein